MASLVTWVDTGREAIDMLSDDPRHWALVLYYLLDTEIHGLEFLVKLQRELPHLNTGHGKFPIIRECFISPTPHPSHTHLFKVLSTGGGVDTATKALKLGALDFMQAPITIDTLRSRIHFYLQYVGMRKCIDTLRNTVEENKEKMLFYVLNKAQVKPPPHCVCLHMPTARKTFAQQHRLRAVERVEFSQNRKPSAAREHKERSEEGKRSETKSLKCIPHTFAK